MWDFKKKKGFTLDMGRHLLQILLTYLTLVESFIAPKILVGIIDQLKFADFVIHYKCLTFSEKAELLKIYSDRESVINLNQNSTSHKHQAFITCTNNLCRGNFFIWY